MTGFRRRLRVDDPGLTAIVVACSFLSVGAFLLDVVGVLAMPFTINAIALPGLVLTLAIAVWAGRVGRVAFLRRLYVGVVAGIGATLAYDAIRAVIMLGAPGDFNPFRSHPNFGALILDSEDITVAAHVVGWAYHAWNGISFAVIYALLAGGARFWFAVAWALALETATVVVYPSVFDVSRSDVAFVAVSFIGHAVYGLTLGILARNWLSVTPSRQDVWRLRVPSLRRGLG